MCQCDTEGESSTFNVSDWKGRGKKSKSEIPGIVITSGLAKAVVG